MDQSDETREAPVAVETLRLLGGRVCLDFANTLDPRHGAPLREYLTSYPDLVAWGQHAGVLTDGEARSLAGGAARRPAEAVMILAQAVALREAIYRTFAAIARGTPPAAPDLALLQEAYANALARARLVSAPPGVAWAWDTEPAALDRVLWPIARSAVELLTAADVGRVKECPGAGDCGWLFLDTSKNGSRRWCSMEGCGSRVKMRRHYARRRTAPPRPTA